jgi:RHS repeat-associated protein
MMNRGNNFWDGLRYFGQGAAVGFAPGSAWQFAPEITWHGTGKKIHTAMTVYAVGQVGLGVIDTIGGAFNGGWSGAGNGAAAFLGNFYMDENNWIGGVWQGFTRHTWEMLQSVVGQGYTQIRNMAGNVDRVDYLGGATFATNENSKKQNGVTFGNFINMNLRSEITGDFDTYVTTNSIFMHEYGHTVDSRLFGLSYLFAIGIPSGISASKHDGTHKSYWTETRANRRAARYFKRHYGVEWSGDILKKQTDAEGRISETAYNKYGQPTGATVKNGSVTELSTVYGYNSDNLLQNTSAGGTGISFTYDNLLRMKTRAETVGGMSMTETYGYTPGKLTKITYSGLSGTQPPATEYVYANGYLRAIRSGSTTVKTVNSKNSFGQTTQYTLGNGTVETRVFDANGLLTQSKAVKGSTVIQDFIYSIDPQKGVLNSRKDNTRNITETFTHDNLHRLTNYTRNGQSAAAVGYSSMGNITSKTDAGTLEYNVPDKPYAIGKQTGNPGSIPERVQDIMYTGFQRPSAIEENGYRVTITYGPDYNRNKMEMRENSELQGMLYYLSSGYEKEIPPSGSSTERLYIGGNAYSAPAVYARTGTGAWSLYYIHRDHLGSITAISNTAGGRMAEYSYDPWGRQRNPATQQAYAPDVAPALLLGRGYAGHEHLPMFGLINMNARLYDPVLGRFLSPDPYVQAPNFSQNFNRYTYCLNNPLMYVDQDGEFWHLIIGAIIGGAVNWTSHGAKLNAQGLSYFGVGALAGALGAGVGTGISSAMAGGGFGAGFIGSSASMSATSSFISGAAIGGGAGFSSGFTAGFGNALIDGKNVGQALGQGGIYGLVGGGSGALLGGITSGIDAVRNDRRFWDGATVTRRVIVEQDIPIVGQVGDNNCLPASAEAVDRSFGGDMTQQNIRNLPGLGGDPNTVALRDGDVWTAYGNASGHSWNFEPYQTTSSTKLSNVLAAMQNGGRVAINLNTGNVGHSVVMQSIVQKTAPKVNGMVVQKLLYYAMNPEYGGSITRITGRNIVHAKNIFYIFP